MADTTDTSVIIVGGSLVGLSTALFLSHHNIPVILLERHLGSSTHPRAIGYTTRTIELLHSVGAASKLPGVQWTGGPPRRIAVENLAGKWQNETHWTQNKQGGKPKGPPPSFKTSSNVEGVAIAQDKIEPVLRARAVELGAQLKLGYKVTEWSQDDNGVAITAVDKDGIQIHVKGKYLIACDGGRSAIREKLGISRHGVGHIRWLRSVMFRAPPIQKYLDHGYSQFSIEGRDDGFEAFLTTYGDGRWMLARHETSEAPATDDEVYLRDLIRQAAGFDIPDDEITIITTGRWEIGGSIADSFSSGRIFLAGDAAHTLPPNRGGYGANTGIADAHNLAWKLSAVLGGLSDAKLLDTYDAERRPVADVRHDQIFAREDFQKFVRDREWPGKEAEIIDDAAMEFGQIYRSSGIIGADDGLPLAKMPEEWKGQPGTRAPHVVLRRGGETSSTLDFFGKSWIVLSKDESWKDSTSAAAKASGIGLEFVQVGADIPEETEGEFERLFGLESTGATLVRPDGFVAWRAVEKPEDAQGDLAKALAKASFAVGS